MNPLRRYHDWATAPGRYRDAQLLFLLPLVLFWTPSIVVAFARRGASFWWEQPLLQLATVLSLLWISYSVVRAVLDFVGLVLRFVRLVGPDWRRGWRAAWREVRGR